MDKCRISIIVPVYNAEDYLFRCLDSILDQSLTSYEVILVDDGSTDSSPLICDRYSATDPRFRTIHKPNGGVSSARNAGISLAKGEYLMFVDSDDSLLPDALELMLDGIAGEDIVIGGYTAFVSGIVSKHVHPKQTRSYRGSDISSFFENNIRHNCEMLDAPWAKLFKRKTVGELRFCEDLSYAEDKLFVFTFLSMCTSVHTCDVPVYGYHLRAGSLGSDIVSDKHLMQLRRFLPAYSQILDRLTVLYPGSAKLCSLYHKDVIGRYVCRQLNIFMTKRTQLLDLEYIKWLYDIMSGDSSLGLFSIRPGQIFNILLYKIGHPDLTVKVYHLTSKIRSIFNA
jgi:glycosyltransferase involved in cell wall biosynthesis